ncbi:Fur family transcriptional regulator [Runella sp. SP2]|uniref:Fur family transcriptional regulator n=1 Tax=Runella sp. SP2 TaxID=2268026 RepID=UPI000F08D90C|nr:Fur family transcriptional regulator [Runella sp. SP2]AYQ33171.1 transcriptional repressor [Runella sp. SP2]
MSTVNSLLKERGLRITPTRKQVLEYFLEATCALSFQDLERKLSDKYDRVTIYRTLLCFLEVGIIQRIAIENGQRFLLRKNNINSHFTCEQCGNISGIETPLPPLPLPQGFVENTFILSIIGTCPNCSE